MNPLLTTGTDAHRGHTALSVNVNLVAQIRNRRPLAFPSVVHLSEIALASGAQGITIHPRPDQRHIRTHDVFDLAELMARWPQAEFNVEGNPLHNLMDLLRQLAARGRLPHQVTFVPDDESQPTSDHGWRFPQDAERLEPLVREAKALGVRVSLFMDPEPAQMRGAAQVGADRVELYTETFASAHGTPEQAAVLAGFTAAAQAALREGLGLNAGHDLNRRNLIDFLRAVPGVQEVSIGHALIADTLELGMAETVRAYLRCIHAASAPTA
jgi:pyridoxine 5-phosphate synthase